MVGFPEQDEIMFWHFEKAWLGVHSPWWKPTTKYICPGDTDIAKDITLLLFKVSNIISSWSAKPTTMGSNYFWHYFWYYFWHYFWLYFWQYFWCDFWHQFDAIIQIIFDITFDIISDIIFDIMFCVLGNIFGVTFDFIFDIF